MRKPQVIPDWKKVVRKAWSIRFAAISGLFSTMEVLLPFYGGDMPRGIFAAVSLFFGIGAGIARFIVQSSMRGGNEDD